jgi:hypothetical protein
VTIAKNECILYLAIDSFEKEDPRRSMKKYQYPAPASLLRTGGKPVYLYLEYKRKEKKPTYIHSAGYW